MRFQSIVSTAIVVALLGITTTAQQPARKNQSADPVRPQQQRLDAADHAERMARIAITGDLGLPPLPPVYHDSPRDDLLYADRFPVGQEATSPGDGSLPVVESGFIPSGPAGTGTPIGEIFRYQVPVDYDPLGAAVPMVIAYHGYGASAGSVHAQSTLDEEASARGWFYMAPTGMDDKLFGPPISQQNVSAAIHWMLDNYNIDPDRLYMVGFSMGGGVVSNFAARRRDPDGLMIAALGVVSGSCDWEQTYHTGTAGLKALMENQYNFGASPFDEPFRYHQASDLRFLPSTYPPPPGTLHLPFSMATNLGSIPTYVVWDVDDTLPEVTAQGPHFVSTLQDKGTELDFHTVSGTVNPANGEPATHSWAVLDEADLFDFFEGKVVDRTPVTFSAKLDIGADVSWLHLAQRFLEVFSTVDGTVDAGAGSLAVEEVSNATFIRVDLGVAGLPGPGPFDVSVSTATVGSFHLQLTGSEDPPAYVIDQATGLLYPGTFSDPATGTLIAPIIGAAPPVDLTFVCDPTWTTSLTTSPNPTAPGGVIALSVDAPATSSLAWLVVGIDELLVPVKGGHVITVSLGPPASLIALPLDANGDVSLGGMIPATHALSGTTILLQTVALGGGATVDSISNRWSLQID